MTTPEPTIPIPMNIEFTATFTGLVDVPISTVIDTTRRLVADSIRAQTTPPEIDDVLNEIATDFNPASKWAPVDYDINDVSFVEAEYFNVAGCEAVADLIGAELNRLADEADPDRAKFRPCPGQLDIFGLEVTP